MAVIALAVCGAGLAHAGDAKALTPKDKAFYLSEKEQSFIRPGLDFQITSAEAATDGTVTYVFTVKDPKGAPLDLDGVTTPGAISVSTVLARIPAGSRTYEAYTARSVSSSISGMTATQATTDSGGKFTKLEDGVYQYTFGTKLPADADRSATHTVAAYVSRDLSEFDLGTNDVSGTFDFVPDGSKSPDVQLSVTDAKCNACHGDLTLHGRRKGVALCVTCHNPGSTDPDSGNTVDMATMVHKIHMGSSLPSVGGGEPYQIIGFRNAVHDYSKVVFPADVRNCQTCHVEDVATLPAPLTAEQRSTPLRSRSREQVIQASLNFEGVAQVGAPDVNSHFLNPSRRACGACHDNVNFATGLNHAGGLPQPSDNQCNRCHFPVGELPFDVSIKGAHTIAEHAPGLPGTQFEILNVASTAPGQTPVVTFSIKNDAGAAVEPSGMGRLALVMGAMQGGDFASAISESATSATGSGGVYNYTFNAAIPEGASGTWAVGIEGYQNSVLLPGTVQEVTVRDAGKNMVSYFNVGGGVASPRRQVVSLDKCNSCHFSLSLHGGNRNDVAQCVLCHNPNGTDAEVRPAEAGAAESINFKEMIHRIHSGEEQTRDFTIYGFRSSVHNYNEVVFPQTLANCESCHESGTQSLPLAADLLPTVDPRGLFNPAPPVTGACTSCHTSVSAAAHADLNTSGVYGESCDVCHGANAEFSVARSHAQ
ncbi:MAG: OmcA/MtrC family decaheme c-type cytochrome [Bryobacterales bacterium]|nr:OmcA/MtrC family decaheme c-type cytochrome [Bryobacterales bacterium]